MESRAITDAQITASSEHSAVHAASHARLNFQEIPNKAAGAWVANASDDNPWLQIDLGARFNKVIMTGVATQGGNSLNYSQWVTNYKLQYGDNGEAFQYYKELGQNKEKVKLLYFSEMFQLLILARFYVHIFILINRSEMEELFYFLYVIKMFMKTG